VETATFSPLWMSNRPESVTTMLVHQTKIGIDGGTTPSTNIQSTKRKRKEKVGDSTIAKT